MTAPNLIRESAQRSAVIWVAAEGTRPEPVWHHWHAGAAYVLTGGIEQPARALATAPQVTVRTCAPAPVTWQATVTRVRPGTPEWRTVIPHLLQHLHNPTPQTPQRWARDCTLFRLTPTVPAPRQDAAASPELRRTR